jgi:hypothetical protein
MVIRAEEMSEGVEGQNLFCSLRGGSDRFYACKLDGEVIEVPTDVIEMEDMGENKVRSESNYLAVNLGTSFFDDDPRIRVECGYTTESESEEVDEFCVYNVEGV